MTKKRKGYQGRTFIREKTYTCGDYVDVDIFPVYQAQGTRRSKCNPTSEVQALLNQKNAERKLVRLIHNNFTDADISLTLTYKTVPGSVEESQKLLTNFLRRLKRLRTKLGLEPLKYITVTEVGKRNGRIHHHCIINGGLDRDAIEKLWGHGYANSQRLQFGENGVTGLAMYIIKDRQTYRRWNSSRNLLVPQPEIRDGAITVTEMSDMEAAHEDGWHWSLFEDKYGFEISNLVFNRNVVNKGSYIHIEARRRRQRE